MPTIREHEAGQLCRCREAIRGREPEEGAALTLASSAVEAWAILRERVTEAKVVEFANLLLVLEASKASGSGALYFNANGGLVEQWGVRGDLLTRVNSLTANVKRG